MHPVKLWLVLPVLGPGGAERVVAELALGLPAFGFEPTVYGLEDETQLMGRELTKAGVRVTGLRKHRRNTLGCARELARLIDQQRPDLIHAHLFHANLAVRLAMAFHRRDSRSRRPLCVNTVHVQERRFRPWQFALDRVTARWSSMEICVSPSVERYHRERTGLEADAFRVIENGIDLTRYAPASPEDRKKQRQRLRLEDDTRLFLAVGRLDKQKDHEALLEAWRSAGLQNAKLWIAGEGPERSRLEQALPPNGELLGFRQDIPDLLAACDVFVQSSAWEGQPLTVLEAMASGCAVVASDIDAHRELIENGVTGVLVAPARKAEWSSTLKSMSQDVDLRKRLGAQAARKARTRHSVERMVASHARLYRELLDGPNTDPGASHGAEGVEPSSNCITS